MAIRILCIGGGNMARAIFSGVFQSADANNMLSQQITKLAIVNPHDVLNDFAFVPAEKISYYPSIAKVDEPFDLVLLAIKPQVLPEIIDDWQSYYHRCYQGQSLNTCEATGQKNGQGVFVLSILAGIGVDHLSGALALPANQIVRAMPNIPISVGMGSTALFNGKNLEINSMIKQHHLTQSSDDLVQNNQTIGTLFLIEQIFKSSGQILWLDQENQMHAYTALCGSSPAYFFHILDVMFEYAQEIGFDSSIRDHLIQVMAGSAMMVKHRPDLSLSQLQAQVTSKGGTTAAALANFANSPSLADKIKQGLRAAQERSKELARLND
jgi:pyrroline-5-carboxylate reductase